MAKKRKKTAFGAAELEMTPMIDVVFQLLIYFVVTMRPMDIAAHLDVFSPGARPPPEEDDFVDPPGMIRIVVTEEEYRINDRSVDADRMRTVLRLLAGHGTDQTIMIHTHPESEHRRLVEVLDGCASVGLHNLSIITTN